MPEITICRLGVESWFCTKLRKYDFSTSALADSGACAKTPCETIGLMRSMRKRAAIIRVKTPVQCQRRKQNWDRRSYGRAAPQSRAVSDRDPYYSAPRR